MMNVLLEKDADLNLIRQRRVAVIGFGNQGSAPADNLRDRGVPLVVGARPDSPSWARAAAAGHDVRSPEHAAAAADFIINLVPDEAQAQVHHSAIEPVLRHGVVLAYGHGFSIHFEQIRPPAEVDVVLIAPVGPGSILRSRFVEGSGIPCLIAVHQDASGSARPLALSYAAALGGGRAGILETSFKHECETDLFGEQAVIVGGVAHLIAAGFETLVEAGYPEELAYFECAHQMKLLVDLIHAEGLAGMRRRISNTARYGDLTRGPRVIDGRTRDRMRAILAEIQSGEFAREWTQEVAGGGPRLDALSRAASSHPIEEVGSRLRNLGSSKHPK